MRGVDGMCERLMAGRDAELVIQLLVAVNDILGGVMVEKEV